MDPILSLLRQRPRENWEWTLDPSEQGWSRGNALALANCALLAYGDPGEIERQLRARGFTAVIPCNAEPGPSDTQAYVAARPDALVIAFRGTEPTNLRDFATDFDAAQVPFEVPGWGRLHEGWAEGFEAVRVQVQGALAQFGDRPWWLTGHSLGGALAMVAAAVLGGAPGQRIAGVYTFGQPRVGDPEFCARYDEDLGTLTFRCVNDRDPVPHLPPRELSPLEEALLRPREERVARLVQGLLQPASRYGHAGRLRLFLPAGGVSANQDDEAAREPPFLAQPRTARSLFLDLGPLLAELPERLKDHAPIDPLIGGGYVERIEALA